MQAVEFNSVINNGYIRVPEKYSNLFDSTVRVIVLTSDKEIAVTTKRKTSLERAFEDIEKGRVTKIADPTNLYEECLK